jgi:hypothetical protein
VHWKVVGFTLAQAKQPHLIFPLQKEIWRERERERERERKREIHGNWSKEDLMVMMQMQDDDANVL